ncbi:HEPN domain-containing protein [Methanobrevibacter sp.]|uniref:HEPN domain-containing protein n=1 Tax=Methanobrevibacter sp. TaxID=66852 RepID=UPI002E78CC89|nr:HEPN domain-containing protein [Methanobrevibacter sp.]MEE0025251.1 hypothetical protein [Methanobrevibacter sp.]
MDNLLNTKGTLWFEDDENNKFNGIILEKNKQYILKTDIESKFHKQYHNKKIIIGNINETEVTIHINQSIFPFKLLSFSIDYLLKNYHNETNLNFKEINIKFLNLEEWIGIKTFKTEYENNVHMITTHDEDITFNLQKFNMTFNLKSKITESLDSFCIKPNYSIKIKYGRETNIKQILKDITLIKKFLIFLMYNNTEIKRITCNIDNENYQLNEIEIHSKLFNTDVDKLNRHDILIHIEEIKNKPYIFEKWFEINKKYKPLFDIYFMNFLTTPYLEYQFLSNTQALEAYLRKNEQYEDNYMSITEYENIKKEFSKFIEKLDISKDHKESLKSRIRYGNEISLRKRLKELINELNEYKIINKLINGNKNKLIVDIVDARNYFTHYDKSSNYKKNNEKLLKLNYKLKILMELCILKELGFENEFIDTKLEIKYNNILK